MTGKAIYAIAAFLGLILAFTPFSHECIILIPCMSLFTAVYTASVYGFVKCIFLAKLLRMALWQNIMLLALLIAHLYKHDVTYTYDALYHGWPLLLLIVFSPLLVALMSYIILAALTGVIILLLDLLLKFNNYVFPKTGYHGRYYQYV